MMGATIHGIPFHVDPSSVAWNYRVKLAHHRTLGGKVVQLLGFAMDDLTVSGFFGRDAIGRQDEFFEIMDSITRDQVPPHTGEAIRPIRFLWPEQQWDFWVYIKAFQQRGASTSIERAMNISNPGYQIIMHVDQDNGDIVKAAAESAQLAYLKRLSAGLGWQQSEWNGPQTAKDLEATLQGQSIFDYAFTQYGITPGSVPMS